MYCLEDWWIKMSYNSFQTACRLIKNFDDFECSGGKPDKVIRKAEKDLNIMFSRQCYEFYKNFDYSVFGGIEIFGIQTGANSQILEGNIVAYALNDRHEYNLPFFWIPFLNFGDGSMAYYDYSTLNNDKEPRIIRAGFVNHKFELIEQLAEDFGDFLQDLIILLGQYKE